MRSTSYFLILILTTGIISGAVSADETAAKPDYLLAYGKLDQQETVEVIDEFGLNVVIRARFHVTGVVDGHSPSSIITVQYIAHTAMREGLEYRLKLRRSSDGTYLVCADGGRGYLCD